MVRNLNSSNGTLRNIVIAAIAVTLSLSPWLNSDSLIIPKGTILFCLGLFLIPILIRHKSVFKSNRSLQLLLVLSLFFLLQMVLVIFASKAPIEQEFFGRTGRALGFATYFSLILVMLGTVIHSTLDKSVLINNSMLLACVISSGYCILQFFGYDIFKWVSLTNGIIGTLGNPNFQSSFIAMALLPALVLRVGNKRKISINILILAVLLYTLFICESTQGYIACIVSVGIFISFYVWFQNKRLFVVYNLIFLCSGIIAVFGMLNKGPLSTYLYKVSVQSRGEMWRTALSTIRDNPWFGIGLDSFGDFSLFYRDLSTANGINEFTDNTHNFFLQFAATGGLILSLIYASIVIFSFYSFLIVLKRMQKFDPNFFALFGSWVSFQLQSFISPANISMLVWNFIICGFLIGASKNLDGEINTLIGNLGKKQDLTRPFSYLLLIFALVIMYPWFNSDRLAWKANETGDGLLAVRAAKMYPESSIRYSRITLALYNSGLLEQSLDVARSAVEFNPRSVQGWFLILANSKAPLEERLNARNQILSLDPFNKEINDIKL
jgi:O-antigen ligase